MAKQSCSGWIYMNLHFHLIHKILIPILFLFFFYTALKKYFILVINFFLLLFTCTYIYCICCMVSSIVMYLLIILILFTLTRVFKKCYSTLSVIFLNIAADVSSKRLLSNIFKFKSIFGKLSLSVELERETREVAFGCTSITATENGFS